MSRFKNKQELKLFLDEKVERYNTPNFIPNDPISIPHLFTKQPDIEIMGFFAATLAWGQRVTILNNCKRLIEGMEGNPSEFIINHAESDLRSFKGFVHRTFNETDLLYFMAALKHIYTTHKSLEELFIGKNMEQGLTDFHNLFFSLGFAPERTKKHLATPDRKSACKRLNMFLRWMVRKDNRGVDFGIWENISPAALYCPLDVHVHRVATQLGLLTRKQADWQATVELTKKLRAFDKEDPVKYDFALYGLGIEEKYGKL